MALLKCGRLALQVGLYDVEPEVAALDARLVLLDARRCDLALEGGVPDRWTESRQAGLRISRFDLGSLATQRDLQQMTSPSGPRFVVFTHKPSMTSVARLRSHDGSESSQISSLSMAPACRSPSISLDMTSSHV